MPQDIDKTLIVALAARANEVLSTTGLTTLPAEDVDTIADELGLQQRDERLRWLRKLDERGLIGLQPGKYEVMGLAALYEERIDRNLFRQRNVLRRDLIGLALAASGEGTDLTFRDGAASFIDRSWLELIVALRYLNWDHLVWLDEHGGQDFSFTLTDEGDEVAQDAFRLSRRLPTSMDEDEYIDIGEFSVA